MSTAPRHSLGRTLRAGLLLVFALQIVAVAGVHPSPVGAQETPTPTLTRETRQLRPVDVVCVPDDSGSEFGPGGTDPFALRYRACELAARYLSAVATDGLDHRFGVVSFGTAAQTRTPALLNLPGQLDEVTTALQNPTDLGDTNYAAGIRAASALFGTPSPERRRIVLLSGDGEPDVPGQSEDQAFADIRGAVADSPADVLVFQVDPAGRAPDLEARWADQGVKSVTRISSLDDGSLERSYIEALRRAVGMDRGDEFGLSADDPSATVEVPNYLEAMSITWFAPEPVRLRLTPADGGAQVSLAAGAVGSHSVGLPAGGRWRITLEHGQRALVAVDLVPVAATVVAPGDQAPMGRSLVVEATFETTDDVAIADVADDPRYFGAVVTDPRGHETRVELERDGRGRYRATRPVPLDRSGDWQVALVMKGQDGNVVGEAGAAFTVTATPWLSIDETLVQSRQPLEMPITLRRGEDPVAADNVLGEDPQAAVVASLVNADGEALETVRARWNGGSSFTARFERALADGEQTWVRVELASQDAEARPVADSVEAQLTAQPSSGVLWGQRIRNVLVVLLVAALASVIAYVAWLAARAPLHGRVDLSQFGGPAVMRVQGGRWRRVDGRNLRSEWIWSQRNGTVRRNVGLAPWPVGADTVPATRRPTAAVIPPRARASTRT